MIDSATNTIRRGLGLALAVWVCLWAAGCRTGPAVRDAESEAFLERRAQGHAHYAAGVLAESEGREPEALAHFRAAAAADPLNETLVLQTVGRLLRARDAASACDLLAGCVRAQGAPASYLAWQGIALMQMGKLEAAIATNRLALARDPVQMLAYQNLAALYGERKDDAAVLRVIHEAAAQTTGEPGYYADVAELYAAYGRMHSGEAESLKAPTRSALERAVALKPAEPWLVLRLAEGFKRLGDWKQAEELYRDMLSKSGGVPLVRENLLDLYLRTDNRKAASELLQQLIRERPGNERATYILGAIAFQENRLDEAEELLSRAIGLDPQLEPAYYELAAVRLTRGEPEEALSGLNEVRRLFKRTFLLEFYSGMAHMRSKRYAEAVRCMAEAEVLAGASEPERLSHVFFFQYGAASERAGDRAGAEKQFRKCLERVPDFAEALNYLGYMWAEKGENLAEARQMIEKAVRLEPDNGAFLDSLGWVLFQQGDFQAAVGWLQKAVEKTEEADATLFEHLGDAYRALGDRAKAERFYQRALEVQPVEAVRQKLEELRQPTGIERSP